MKTSRLRIASLAAIVAVSPVHAAPQEQFIYRKTLPVDYIAGGGTTDPGTDIPDSDGIELLSVQLSGPIGHPFSRAIPLKTADVVEWQRVSGSFQQGLEIDPATGVISGTPRGSANEKEAILAGYDSAGRVVAKATATFNFYELATAPSSFTLNGYRGRYLFRSIPTSADVARWEPDGDLPTGIQVSGLALDGIPVSTFETTAVFSGYDYLGNRVASASGKITVKDGPETAPIADVLQHPSSTFSVKPTVTYKVGNPSFRLHALDGLPEGLEFNTSSGEISGKIATFGTSLRFKIEVTDSDGTSSLTNEFKLSTFEEDANIFAMRDLSGTVGRDFSIKFVSSETPQATWTVAGGALPEGLVLDPTTGVLSGTPAVQGLWENIVVSAVSPQGEFETRPFTFTVYPEELAVAFAPVRARVNTPFISEAPKFLFGVVTPWSLSIAPGGKIDSHVDVNFDTGVVTGNLPATGNYNVAFDFNNGDGRRATFIQPITAYNPLSVTYPNNSNARRRSETKISPNYPTDSLVGAATFTIESGTLPDGLSINPRNGIITGIPKSVTTATEIRVRISDETGTSATSNAFSITVADRADVTVATQDVTVERFAPVNVKGATAGNTFDGATFALVEGELPSGLHLDTDGRIRGTTDAPVSTVSGLVIQVTDGEGRIGTSSPFNLTVAPPSNLEVLAATPKSAVWSADRHFSFKLPKPHNGFGDLVYTISNLEGGVSLSADTISGVIPDIGIHTFSVGITDSTGRSTTTSFKIDIKPAMSASLQDQQELKRLRRYSASPVVLNGIAPVTYSFTGTMPTGIYFDDGELNGTPTTSGQTASGVVVVSDAAGSRIELPVEFTVAERDPIDLDYDFSANLIKYSGPYQIQPTISNFTGRVQYEIAGSLPPGMQLDPITGTVSGKPQQDGRWPDIRITATDGDGAAFATTAGPYEAKVALDGPIGLAEETNIVVRSGALFTETIRVSNATAPLTFSSASENGLPYNLSLDASSGVMTGHFAEAGRYLAQVRVTDHLSRSKATKVVFTAVGNLSITAPSNTGLNQYSKASLRPTATNVIGAATYSLSGTLPDGLSFNTQTGEIAGTPTRKQTAYGLRITVKDRTNASVTTASFSIVVGDRIPLAMDTKSSYGVIANQNFGLTLKATNGFGNITYEHTAGDLPTGIVFDAEKGMFRGVATVIGTFPGITVKATDAIGGTVTKTFSFVATTNGQSIGMTTTAFTTKVGFAIETAEPVVTNAVGDVSFRGDSTLARYGLTIDEHTGVITGTATELMDVNVNVSVTDSSNRLTSRTLRVRVIPPTVISAPEQVNTVVNANMGTVTVTRTNLVGTSTVSVEGKLPVGVTFAPSTGRFTGTPNEMGTFDIVIKSIDSTGEVATKDMTINVANNGQPPQIAMNLDQTNYYVSGNAYTINLPISNAKTGDVVTVSPGYSLPPRTTLSKNTSGIWVLTKTAGGTNDTSLTPLKLRVTDSLGLYSETAEQNFVIRPANMLKYSDATITTYKDIVLNVAAPGFSGGVMGTKSFAFSKDITGGTVSINATTGVITGATGVAGTNIVTVTETLSNVVVRSHTYNVTFSLNDLPEYTIASGKAVVGKPITNTAATGTVTYSILSGAPQGISMHSTTGALQGTHTGASQTYVIKAQSRNATSTSTFDIPVTVVGADAEGSKFWKFEVTAVSSRGHFNVYEIGYALPNGTAVREMINTSTTGTQGAYDGNNATGWSNTQGQGTQVSIVSFSVPMNITNANLYQQTLFGSGLGRYASQATALEISKSDDGTNWTVVKSASWPGSNLTVSW